jgi:hypothetical protein
MKLTADFAVVDVPATEMLPAAVHVNPDAEPSKINVILPPETSPATGVIVTSAVVPVK